jgi:preprotein translocase subunit SecB
LLAITATFIAEYEMAEGFSPSSEELNAFVNANAVFNCWPYWREYVHSTAARMNLPPLTLPFFRVRAPQPAEQRRFDAGNAGIKKLKE